MILVDTSVWIHFFKGQRNVLELTKRLENRQIVCHTWIISELMLGDLGPKRDQILSDLMLLPILQTYAMEDIKLFVEDERLYAKGLSLIDVQLLYAGIIEGCLLWSHDKALVRIAETYNKAFLL